MSNILDPKAFERKLQQQRDSEIRALRSEYDQKKSSVRSTADTKIGEINKQISEKDRIDASGRSFTGAATGAVLGLFSCTSPRSYQYGFGGQFGIWVTFIVVGAILFWLFTIAQKDTSSLQKERESLRTKEMEDVSRLDSECEAKIRQIEKTYEQGVIKHQEEFARAQREASLTYIDSPVAKEITDFMLKPLLKTIRSCDRRPHVKVINVPFSFEVYSNKVTSTYGTYDFEIERVQFLKTMEEQAALANAIATAIHTEIITTFEVDPSGGEVDPMDIDYQYGANYVKASMTYHAANGNFVEARSF